jgi:hypothetical protein
MIMSEVTEILKAKATAVRALADALETAVSAGQAASAEQLVDLAEIWAQAVESMVPAEPVTEAKPPAKLQDMAELGSHPFTPGFGYDPTAGSCQDGRWTGPTTDRRWNGCGLPFDAAVHRPVQ